MKIFQIISLTYQIDRPDADHSPGWLLKWRTNFWREDAQLLWTCEEKSYRNIYQWQVSNKQVIPKQHRLIPFKLIKPGKILPDFSPQNPPTFNYIFGTWPNLD